MKNKFWAVVIAILIFVPTVVAVASYFSSGGSPVNQNSISQVIMTDLYNEEYSFERREGNKSFSLDSFTDDMVQFFTDVSTKATEEPELPEPIQGTKYYKVTFNNYGRNVDYKFYFTEKPEYCYYTDADNKCFKINQEYASAFLNSIYGRSVFKSATLPVMTTTAGEVIDPTSVKWTYLAANDMAPTYSVSDGAAYTETVYNIAETVGIAFTIPASSITVKVSDGDEELYNNVYEELVFKSLPTNKQLKVDVTAKWYKTEDRQSEGEATYSFNCKLTDKPAFYLTTNADTVVPGDFINITAKNISCEPSAITFSSTPALKHTPVFYTDDYYTRALLPIATDTEPGMYTLTLTADGITQTLDFTVTEKTYSEKQESISSTALSNETLKAFDTAVGSVLSEASAERLFGGEWIYPVKGSVVSSGFGRPTVTQSGFAYTNSWVRVLANSGSDVIAMNAGKVVYVGEQTMTGKLVVLDHGLGLKTVYANMTSVTVKVGDTVATGDTLGVSGAAGYSDGSTVSVAMTLNGIYVCPYEVWDENGVVFPEE